MGGPLPPTILVEGQTAYLNPYSGGYSPNRAYALRMQRGYARGLTQTQARRGVELPPDYSESQVRRERFQATYGISYNYYRRLQVRYGADIVNNRPGAISPLLVGQAVQLQAQGLLPPNWVEDRLADRRIATDNYRAGITETGEQEFDDRIEFVPIEWWYYH